MNPFFELSENLREHNFHAVRAQLRKRPHRSLLHPEHLLLIFSSPPVTEKPETDCLIREMSKVPIAASTLKPYLQVNLSSS